MPEPFMFKIPGLVGKKPDEIQHTVPSEPVKALQIEDVEKVVHESLLHPMRAIEDIVGALNLQNALLDSLVRDNLTKRQYHDDVAQLGATLNYRMTYHNHTYVYVFCSTSFTIVASNGARVNVPANYYTLVNFPAGVYLSALNGNDSNPVLATFRSCDVPLENGTSLIAQANANVSVPTGAGNTVIKNSPGMLASITVTTAGTGAGNVQIFDNATTNSGTVLYAFPATISVPNNFTILMPAVFGMVAQNVLNGPVFTVGFA